MSSSGTAGARPAATECHIYNYTPEDLFADNAAAAALMEATCDLLKKLHREGLQDYVEFDKGITALRHWYQRENALWRSWNDLPTTGMTQPILPLR